MPSNIADYEFKLQTILTRKLPARVAVDDLGNTISRRDWRREQCAFLATTVSRIAWGVSAIGRAKALIAKARRLSK